MPLPPLPSSMPEPDDGPGDLEGLDLEPGPPPPIVASDAPRPRGIRGRAEWYEQASAASVGIEMAVAITLGALSGMWLEAHVTHWAPWTTLIGLMFGCGAASMAVWRTVRDEQRRFAASRALEGSNATPPPDPSGPRPGAPPDDPSPGEGPR